MNQRISALIALLLSLCLLCGCSGASTEEFRDLITNQETPADEPEQDEPTPEMAADTVLQDLETLEVLHLGYQESYGLNPFTTESLCNRAITNLLYEPLYVVYEFC